MTTPKFQLPTLTTALETIKEKNPDRVGIIVVSDDLIFYHKILENLIGSMEDVVHLPGYLDIMELTKTVGTKVFSDAATYMILASDEEYDCAKERAFVELDAAYEVDGVVHAIIKPEFSELFVQTNIWQKEFMKRLFPTPADRKTKYPGIVLDITTIVMNAWAMWCEEWLPQ